MEPVGLCRHFCAQQLLSSFARTTLPSSIAPDEDDAGDLDEGELFLFCTQPPLPAPGSMAGVNPAAAAATGFHQATAAVRDRASGILAALAEDDHRRMLRNPSFAHRSLTPPALSPSSASPSSASPSARMIPAAGKARGQGQGGGEFSFSVGAIRQQSAPMRIPVPAPRRARGPAPWEAVGDSDDNPADAYAAAAGLGVDKDDEGFVPPHEIVDRARAKASPMMMTFSVLEGAGRTLKGRDLRRVRNAVLRQTGFLD